MFKCNQTAPLPRRKFSCEQRTHPQAEEQQAGPRLHSAKAISSAAERRLYLSLNTPCFEHKHCGCYSDPNRPTYCRSRIVFYPSCLGHTQPQFTPWGGGWTPLLPADLISLVPGSTHALPAGIDVPHSQLTFQSNRKCQTA